MKRKAIYPFLLLWLFLYSSFLSAQSNFSFQYWFNNDLNAVKTKQLSAIVDQPFDINLSALELPEGLNVLHCRVLNTDNKPSGIITTYFVRGYAGVRQTFLEYWFDNDTSQKQQITVTNPDQIIDFSANISNLSVGLHSVHIRTGFDFNTMTAVKSAYFYKLSASERIPVIEYWFDNNLIESSKINLTNSDSVIIINALTNDLSVGLHSFHIRTGYGSTTMTSSQSCYFYKLPHIPQNGKIEYWFDNDYANRIVYVNDEPDILRTLNIDASALTTGKHKLSVRTGNIYGVQSAIDTAYFQKAEANELNYIRIENDPALSKITPNEVTGNANVFYYYKLKNKEDKPVQNTRVVLLVNGKEVIGELSDSDGLALVNVPVYGVDVNDINDDLISAGNKADVIVSHLMDISNKKMAFSTDTKLEPRTLLVNQAWEPSELSVNVMGGIAAEAGWSWAKVSANVDLSMDLQFSFTDNSVDKIKFKGALDGAVNGSIHTPKTIESAQIGITGGVKGGLYSELEINNRFEAYLLLLRDLMVKNKYTAPELMLGVQAMDYLCQKYNIILDRSELFVRSGTGSYWGYSAGIGAEIFKNGAKQIIKGTKKNVHINLENLSFSGNASITYSDVNETNYLNNLKSNIEGTEIEFSGEVGTELDISTRWRHVNKWSNLTYPLKLNEINSVFNFDGFSENLSRDLTFSLSVSKKDNTNYCSELVNNFEDKIKNDIGVSGVLGVWFDAIKENAGIDAGAKTFRKNTSTLKTTGQLANIICENPNVGYELFPMEEGKIYNINPGKQYDIFNGNSTFPVGLHDIANPPACFDMSIDKDLTYSEKNNYGIEFYAKYPIFNYKIVKFFIEGGLTFDMEFPRLEQYYDRISGKWLTGYLNAPIDQNNGGTVLKNAINTLTKDIKDAFNIKHRKEVEESIDYANNNQTALVGAGTNLVFTNANTIRRVSRVLYNYERLRTKAVEHASIMSFDVPSSSFNSGDSINFGHFYTGGDLIGSTITKDTITAISDVFSLIATDNKGNRIFSASHGSFQLTTKLAKEDLTLLGFPETMPVHLYFMSVDSTRWTDLGVAVDDTAIEVNNLGFYLLGTSVKGDKQAPIITAGLDSINKQIIIDITENLALSPEKVIASYNGNLRPLVQLSANRFALKLEDEEMKKDGYLIINATDIAGNKGILEKAFLFSLTEMEDVSTEKIALYPSIIKDYLQIKIPAKNNVIRIYAVDGTLIKTVTDYTSNTKIDVSFLHTGLYLVRIYCEDGKQFSVKCIKE